MTYFLELGKDPALSLAEIHCLWGYQPELPHKKIALLEGKTINAKEMIKKMGGVVKIGEIEDKIRPDEDIKRKIADYLISVGGRERIIFGLSNYGADSNYSRKTGLKIKDLLKNEVKRVRLAGEGKQILSSASVENNKLIRKGAEITLIKKGDDILIGRTLAVQPFKDLSFRDYGRPRRDDRSGMLPPKLAQIMINLADEGQRDNKNLLDPFCGSGTILSEATMMGYKKLIGSDISKKAVSDTKKNMDWLERRFNTNNDYVLFEENALSLRYKIKDKSVDAIATEGYLGPQRGKIDIGKTIKELEKLYFGSLEVMVRLVKKNGYIVMAWPEIKGKQLFEGGLKLPGGLKVEELLKGETKEITGYTKRDTIIYKRPGQKIGREIIKLKVKI